MRQEFWIGLLGLSLLLYPVPVFAQAGFCPSGEQPHFSYGFAFLKSQLGALMGEPLECEHYDAAGNATQKTSTGQAFYDRSTNTPVFTSGSRHWAWTLTGIKQWTEVPPSSKTPLATPSHEPLTIRVMSYNVLFGAGAEPGWERAAAQLSPFAYPGNRLPEILEIIKAAQPDIVGIEEAADWDNGSPSIVQQVADELGLNYYLAPVGNGLHLALFTRFQIVEAENLSERMGNVGALRVTLSLPSGQLLTVFVVHLDPFSATTRSRELAILTQEMTSYLPAPTLLLGDMNFYCLDTPEQCREYQVLTGAGWHLALSGQYKIDQIWTSPGLDQPVEAITFPGASFDISDHLPIGTVFKIPPWQ